MRHGTYSVIGVVSMTLVVCASAVLAPGTVRAEDPSGSGYTTFLGPQDRQATCAAFGPSIDPHHIGLLTTAATSSARSDTNLEALQRYTPRSRTTPNHDSSSNRGADVGSNEADAPCSRPDDSTENLDKLCFMGVRIPASVRPETLARSTAVARTNQVVDSAHKMLGVDEIDAATHPSAEPDFDSDRILDLSHRTPPVPSNACTIRHPENCKKLPPLPSSLALDVLPSIAETRPSVRELPDSEGTATNDGIAHRHHIRPSRGYDSPPHKPPRG